MSIRKNENIRLLNIKRLKFRPFRDYCTRNIETIRHKSSKQVLNGWLKESRRNHDSRASIEIDRFR